LVQEISMQTLNARVALLAIAMVTTGCATQMSKVRVDSAEGGLPSCQTFAWNPISGDAASFTDQRVRTEVMQALQAKGYTESADKPDCRIAYHLSTQEIPKSKPGVGVGVGGGSGGLGGGIGINIPIGKRPGQSGTFTLDVIDATKNAQVWSGSVESGFDSTELSDTEAKAVVQKVLAEFPDRAGK
jgi:hypothetical protein